MNLKGRRQSSNVDDRRSTVKKVAIGGGLGAVVIAAIMTLLNGGNMGDVVQQVANNALSGQTENYTPTAQEEEFAVFAKQILASTEDVWTAEFKKLGRTYKAPTMVLFHSSVQSGCGAASSAMGPFYCSADECLYLDLDFFNEMPKSLGAGGDFAYAYVIAHEVGHHVEHLLGILDEAHSTMSRQNETEKNKTSVRIELLADYYGLARELHPRHLGPAYALAEEGIADWRRAWRRHLLAKLQQPVEQHSPSRKDKKKPRADSSTRGF